MLLMGAEMTVAEFAAETSDACGCGDRLSHCQQIVDRLIEAAVARNKVLWEVGVDAEGRVSLIWRSYPYEAWVALNHEAARLDAVKRALGLRP